jgi:hypothetical protein
VLLIRFYILITPVRNVLLDTNLMTISQDVLLMKLTSLNTRDTRTNWSNRHLDVWSMTFTLISTMNHIFNVINVRSRTISPRGNTTSWDKLKMTRTWKPGNVLKLLRELRNLTLYVVTTLLLILRTWVKKEINLSVMYVQTLNTEFGTKLTRDVNQEIVRTWLLLLQILKNILE